MPIVQVLPVHNTNTTYYGPVAGGVLDGELKQPQQVITPVVPTIHSGLVNSGPLELHNELIDYVPVAILTIPNHIGFDTNVSNRHLDFGVFNTGAPEIMVTLTNTLFETLTVADISFLSMIGVEVDGLAVLDTVAPLETITFTVRAIYNIGMKSVASYLQIRFTNGAEITYDLSIVREEVAYVYSLEPEAGTYSESITYRTEVVTFTNGREARRALMSTPKRRAKYKTIAYNNELLDYTNNLSHFGMNNAVMQPLWSQQEKVLEDILLSTTIPTNTVDKDYVVGGNVVVISNALYPRTFKITSVNDNYLEIDDAVTIEAPFYAIPQFAVLPQTSRTHSNPNVRLGTIDYDVEEI